MSVEEDFNDAFWDRGGRFHPNVLVGGGSALRICALPPVSSNFICSGKDTEHCKDVQRFLVDS